MNVLEILLAGAGILAGAWAAFKNDAQVAGFGVILVGLAVLLPLVLK